VSSCRSDTDKRTLENAVPRTGVEDEPLKEDILQALDSKGIKKEQVCAMLTKAALPTHPPAALSLSVPWLSLVQVLTCIYALTVWALAVPGTGAGLC
jgi:hypothetical protein